MLQHHDCHRQAPILQNLFDLKSVVSLVVFVVVLILCKGTKYLRYLQVFRAQYLIITHHISSNLPHPIASAQRAQGMSYLCSVLRMSKRHLCMRPLYAPLPLGAGTGERLRIRPARDNGRSSAGRRLILSRTRLRVH